jgi:hypothetical protein
MAGLLPHFCGPDAVMPHPHCIAANRPLTSFLGVFLANPDQTHGCIKKAIRDGNRIKPVVLHRRRG